MKLSHFTMALASLAGALTIVTSVSAAGVQYVSVQAEGEGSTASQATASALSSAVAQVNGASLESSQLSTDLMKAVDTEAGSTFASESAMAEVVSQQTKGLVRNYRIVSKVRDGNFWTVEVEARVAKYDRSTQTNRLRMSVLRPGRGRWPLRIRTQCLSYAEPQVRHARPAV